MKRPDGLLIAPVACTWAMCCMVWTLCASFDPAPRWDWVSRRWVSMGASLKPSPDIIGAMTIIRGQLRKLDQMCNSDQALPTARDVETVAERLLEAAEQLPGATLVSELIREAAERRSAS